MAPAIDSKALTDDVSALSEFLMKLTLDGGAACSLPQLEQLRKSFDTPAIRAVPKLAEMLEVLEGTMRTYLSTRGAPELCRLMDEVLDCFYLCRAVKTYLQGKFNDVPALEEIFGAARPDRKEETLSALELVEVGYLSVAVDAERRADTSFLLDLGSGQIVAEELLRTATATRPSAPKPAREGLLRVGVAQLAPGFAPRKVRFDSAREEPLEKAHVERALAHAKPTLDAIQKEYRAFRSNFFAPAALPVLVVPKGFYSEDEKISLVDKAGHLLALTERPGTTYVRDRLLTALPGTLAGAVFGKVFPRSGQLVMQVLGYLGLDSAGKPIRPEPL